ncbi:MAG: alpha/beta hydrolase [Bacteroidales bacterium]|nr:MAG: alpha/beta hydrolase [Bacteroidales bacterium]
MEKIVKFEKIEIFCRVTGKGVPVVLLHGYLESSGIWNVLAEALSRHFKVIVIDLPGHGNSGTAGKVHTMEFMADSVASVLDHLNVESCIVVGHSMGGYVSLAFLEKYPERLSAFSLFHSHPLADGPETKNNRGREILFVREGRKDLIFNTNIPKAFASDNLEKCRNEIDSALTIAENTPDDGIIAALNGMMKRPDRQELLQKTKIPFLWILGKKDNYIPFDAMIEKIVLPVHGKLEVLVHSGHQGFLEEKELSLKILSDFFSSVTD